MFRKRLHKLKNSNESIWIVNLDPSQARTDAKIVESGHPVFTEKEISYLKDIPQAYRDTILRLMLRCKKNIPEAEIIYYGEEKYRGEVATTEGRKKVLPDNTPKRVGSSSTRRKTKRMEREEAFALVQRRLI